MGQRVWVDLSDEQLVRLHQVRKCQDDRPFQEIMRRHQRMVWQVCYGFTHNRQDAEDLTQEVFFKIYRHLETFEERSTLKTWIYRIAVHTSQNELRHRNRRPKEAETAVEDMAEFLPTEHTVESLTQEQLRQENLGRAMSQLSDKDLEILRLKDLENHPYQDIANKLGIGLSATKMRVQRARLTLQTIYRELETEA